MNRSVRSAVRTLISLGVIIAALLAGVVASVELSDGEWTPNRALDLAGGTQIILEAVPDASGRAITSEDITQAVGIIRQRVDSSGVSEAQVSSQGQQNIVVELPGDPDEQAGAIELVSQSAQMTFRSVLATSQGVPLDAQGNPLAGSGGLPSSIPAPAAPVPDDGATDGATEPTVPSTDNRVLPSALLSGSTPAPTDPAATDPAATDPAAPEATPTDPSDLGQITPELQQQFLELDCTDPANRTGGLGDDPRVPLVTCQQDGLFKYILGPVEVEGRDIDTASAGMQTNQQGASTGQWVVQLDLTNTGAQKFRVTSERLVGLTGAQNQFAIVLDGLVVSAPAINSAITDGNAEISGGFTQTSATALANQLRFGALPLSFDVQTQEQISPTLGAEQLTNGLLAGLVGMALVCIFSLLQYRALGLVTIASLLIAAAITYGSLLLLSWGQGYRLSLPAIAGTIVAIGVTADSFIVYFERVRDEVREGRSLNAAVEIGWARARRTIIISDVINLLAAVVLYLLAVGGVRGFAFTLGLTTVIDLLVVMLFTHPMLTLLARTRFFGGGHTWSGFDAEHLGRTVAYAGRGRVRPPVGRARKDAPARLTLAERKARASQAEAGTGDDGPGRADGSDADGTGTPADLTKAGSGSSGSSGSHRTGGSS